MNDNLKERLAKAIARSMPGWNEDTEDGMLTLHWERVNQMALKMGREYAEAALKELNLPPDGWFYFGAHVEFDGPLEFSEEVGVDGMPLWERHVPKDPNTVTVEFTKAEILHLASDRPKGGMLGPRFTSWSKLEVEAQKLVREIDRNQAINELLDLEE